MAGVPSSHRRNLSPPPLAKLNSRKHAKWTDDNDNALLTELLAVKASGGMVEGGFKKSAFGPIASKLEVMQMKGGAKTASTCQTRTKMVHIRPHPSHVTKQPNMFCSSKACLLLSKNSRMHQAFHMMMYMDVPMLTAVCGTAG